MKISKYNGWHHHLVNRYGIFVSQMTTQSSHFRFHDLPPDYSQD
jgi:hypothetical protein